jgi:hypothetical protein
MPYVKPVKVDIEVCHVTQDCLHRAHNPYRASEIRLSLGQSCSNGWYKAMELFGHV